MQACAYHVHNMSIARVQHVHSIFFRRAECRTRLGANNWCIDSAGQLFCKPHFMQLLKAGGEVPQAAKLLGVAVHLLRPLPLPRYCLRSSPTHRSILALPNCSSVRRELYPRQGRRRACANASTSSSADRHTSLGFKSCHQRF